MAINMFSLSILKANNIDFNKREEASTKLCHFSLYVRTIIKIILDFSKSNIANGWLYIIENFNFNAF